MAKSRNNTDRQNTRLNKKQSAAYESMSTSTPILRDTVDYDAKGLFKELYKSNKGDVAKVQKALTPGSDTEHVGTDRYKKSNHPTFSNESKYSNVFHKGGKWSDNTFTATKRNIKNMTQSDGSPENYMNRAEDYNNDGKSDVQLIKPGMKKQLPKYRMGVQEVDVNTADKKDVGGAVATGAMSGAAMGATLGSVVPGWGTAVGAVVGGAVGGVTAGLKQSKTNKSIDKKQSFNTQAKSFNDRAAASDNAATYIDSRNTVLGAKVNRMDVAKNGKKSIAKGKLVEVEGGEAITHPHSTSIAKVVSGPSHAQGGVKMVLPKGVSIIPVKDTPAFVAGDDIKRAKIKSQLPDDTNPRLYKKGVNAFDVHSYTGSKPGKQYDFNEQLSGPVPLPKSTNPFSNESLGLNKPTKIDSTIPDMGGGKSTSVDKPISSKPVVDVPNKVSTANTAGSIAGNTIALAPSIYNLGRGLTEKAATTQTQVTAPAYIDPKVDTTYQKALIEKQSNVATDAAATLGGGNAAMLANRVSSIQAGKIGALNELANDKYLAENENRKYNTTLQNDFSARKDAAFTYAKDADMQNVARKNDFVGASMTGVSDLYQSRENTQRQEKFTANQNEAYINALQSKDFKYDPNTGMQLNKPVGAPTVPTVDASTAGSSPMSSYSKSMSRKLLKNIRYGNK